MATTTDTLRVIDFRTGRRPRDDKGRFLPTFTLSYEATLPGGEVARFVRSLTADGVEMIGRKLTSIDFDDPRIDNIEVTDRNGCDVTFGFACFAADEWPTGTQEQQVIAMRLLTFIPPEHVAA
jgi:hypothetical protein